MDPKELKVLIEQYEKEGRKISSWYGDCDGNPYMTKLNILNRGYGYEPILDKKDDLKYPSFRLPEMINSIEDIENKFLCNDNLRLVGKQEFYDNNKNYLISFFYRRPVWWKKKIRLILDKEYPFYKFFSTKGKNDYTFGSIFLQLK